MPRVDRSKVRKRTVPRFLPKRGACAFCSEKAKVIDYKDVSRLRTYISDRGRIEPRRRTNACAKHQRFLARAIKRARFLALLPFTPEHIHKTGFKVRE